MVLHSMADMSCHIRRPGHGRRPRWQSLRIDAWRHAVAVLVKVDRLVDRILRPVPKHSASNV
eukprot:7682084-Pyramimonas_sp.AAC.1